MEWLCAAAFSFRSRVCCFNSLTLLSTLSILFTMPLLLLPFACLAAGEYVPVRLFETLFLGVLGSWDACRSKIRGEDGGDRNAEWWTGRWRGPAAIQFGVRPPSSSSAPKTWFDERLPATGEDGGEGVEAEAVWFPEIWGTTRGMFLALPVVTVWGCRGAVPIKTKRQHRRTQLRGKILFISKLQETCTNLCYAFGLVGVHYKGERVCGSKLATCKCRMKTIRMMVIVTFHNGCYCASCYHKQIISGKWISIKM